MAPSDNPVYRTFKLAHTYNKTYIEMTAAMKKYASTQPFLLWSEINWEGIDLRPYFETPEDDNIKRTFV